MAPCGKLEPKIKNQYWVFPLKIILLAVVALLAAAGGLAVALNHYFGWKGLLAFPVLLVGLVWLGKLVIARLVKRFFLGLVGMKARVLRGASLTVHSIVPVPKPEPLEADADSEDKAEDEGEPEPDEEPEEHRVYYEIDMTITPRHNCNAVWEPTELILTSQPIKGLEDLEENDLGTTYDCRLWNGSAFVEDDWQASPSGSRECGCSGQWYC